MAATQTVLFTAVPNGYDRGTDTYRVSIVVSPRLTSDSDTTLATFPDWVDWPATAGGITWKLRFPNIPKLVTLTPASSPSSQRWAALFPSTTFVRGQHLYQGLDHRRVRSYPVKSLIDFFADRWGRFAVSNPVDPPSYDVLAADRGFGPVGFEQLGREARGFPDGDGPHRKARYLAQLESGFDPTSNLASRWALPFDPAALSTPQGTAKQFLQLERFHRRGRADRGPTPAALTPPALDFHDAIAHAMNLVTLPRLLGLVLDFTFPRSAVGTDLADTRVQAAVTWTPLLAQAVSPIVRPNTRSQVGDIGTGGIFFQPIPRNPNDTDYTGRWLAASDGQRFLPVQVDPDNGGLKTRQFADNVTRSRGDQPFSSATPDTYTLPSHSSAGLSMARIGRASALALDFQRSTQLNSQAVGPTGTPTGTNPDLFLEDLVRGLRWDVDQGDGWLSLMGQRGQYRFLTQGSAGVLDVEEEGVVAVSATNAGGTDGDPNDLYVSESLMRWSGWSLANSLVGTAIGPDDQPLDVDNTPPADGFQFVTTFSVPPGSLPRLRFGRSYRLRARVVDLAGNSEPAAGTVEPPPAVTGGITYHRYDPVPSPPTVLRDPATPGETHELLVIRSEDRPDPTATTSARHVVPPQASQMLAELHGKLDRDATTGKPLDKAAYDQIKVLDHNSLANHPDAVPDETGPGSTRFPVDHLHPNYLPDPLAHGAVVRNLPPTDIGGGVMQSTAFVRMDTAGWPTGFDSFRIDLVGGSSNRWDWDDANRVLTVTLDKAEVVRARLSSRFATSELGLLGVWQWILDQSPPAATLSALQRAALGGAHWMLTPFREVRLVHAVRTPLLAPDLTDAAFSATKAALGQTFALLQRQVTFHRKSTSSIDLVAAWSMNVDTGPGGPDPTVAHDFRATAATLPVDPEAPEPSPPGRLALSVPHEFGDTKYRQVSYTAVATSAFTELFRESTASPLTLSGTSPVLVDGRGLEPETVKVTDTSTGAEYRRALPGLPASGDFDVDGGAGTITRTPASTIPDGSSVDVSFVVPELHTTSVPRVRVVKSSARPAAPKPRWVLPTFRWSGRGTSWNPSTKRSGLRIYLERPWWSSGDGELLGVVLWPGPPPGAALPMPDAYKPVSTMWGFDPLFAGPGLAPFPSAADFPLASSVVTGLPLPDIGAGVDVAAHRVAFDPQRDLWYCDVDIDTGLRTRGARAYWPFIRLALARYQPQSLTGGYLSPVVLADFAQLAPDRAVSVTGTGPTRVVTVTGRTYTAVDVSSSPSLMRLTVERKDPTVGDPDLGWTPLLIRRQPSQITVAPSLSDGNFGTWTGSLTISIGPSRPQQRIVIEELESHETGQGELPPGQSGPPVPAVQSRVVHTDVIPLP
ncbi:MAG: hypothetical protein HYX34_02385 [Actinobacteria bacterium]|nr:hypothetical protein [Actinomycetota bacterium]